MAKTRTLTLVLLLFAGAAALLLISPAHAASCEAIVGRWEWFGWWPEPVGVLTVKPDGTMVHELGDDGTWRCTDPTRGVVTLRWRLHRDVNTVLLSQDGQKLASTDPSRWFVRAKRIEAPSSPPPPTPGGAGEVKAHKVTPKDSREIARLVARLHRNYQWDTPEFHWPSDPLFYDGYIRKGHALTLGHDFTLVERYLECAIPDWNWGVSKDRLKPPPYRMSANSITDCDTESHDLRWQEKTVPLHLTLLQSSSIRLTQTNTGSGGPELRISFSYLNDPYASGSIRCKNRNACEQMMADLKKLVKLAQKSGTAKKRND